MYNKSLPPDVKAATLPVTFNLNLSASLRGITVKVALAKYLDILKIIFAYKWVIMLSKTRSQGH